uniref:Uncharacterized protein n=1 Tax=mine drainage metagenome TaxID=410659 RepID=E6PQB1_9ZZZZ
MRTVDEAELRRWRELSAADVVVKLATYAKRDAAFVPIKNPATRRWHVNAQGQEFELLLTGSKFFDTRMERGGGGAVDLAKHLLGLDFRRAVEILRRCGL